MWVLRQCSPRVCDGKGNVSEDSLNTNLMKVVLIWWKLRTFLFCCGIKLHKCDYESLLKII